MSDLGSWVPIGAFVISIATLLFAAFGLRDKSTKDYLEQVQSRLATAEEDLEKCRENCDSLERERNELRSDNYELMRRMIGMPDRKNPS